MEADKIIKALRLCEEHICSCDCPFWDGERTFQCEEKLKFETSALIKSLQVQLARKCEHEQRAMKCICDVEAYLDFECARHCIRKTIDAWREDSNAPDRKEAD